MPFSYLILLCVCEILKNHTHSYGPFASPIRLKVFHLNSLFFLSTRFWNTLLYSQMQILFKRPHLLRINLINSLHFLFTMSNNALIHHQGWIIYSLYRAFVSQENGGGKEARTPDP